MPESNKQVKKERSLSSVVRELTVVPPDAQTEPSHLIELSFEQPIFKLVGVTSEYVCIDSDNATASSTPRVSERKTIVCHDHSLFFGGAFLFFIRSTKKVLADQKQ